MASISEIQELAMQLSLSYTAKGAVDLRNEKLSNLQNGIRRQFSVNVQKAACLERPSIPAT